jgi:PIN domain nuclease of toxin-antitoxin system
LPLIARKALTDPKAELFVSIATVWEIAIKAAIGKLRFPVDRMASILDDANCLQLPIKLNHALQAAALPNFHADPFDRMLIAQAQQEGLTLVTNDSMIRRYPVAILGES